MKNCWCVFLATVLVSGCGESHSNGTPPAITVRVGGSIQSAIDAAPANSTIYVEPGVYHESASALSAVIISKDGIQLVGRSTPGHPVVLENSGAQQNGIVVAPMDSVEISADEHPGEHPPCGENGHVIHSFSLKGFTVRGFGQFGVYLACLDGFELTDNFADSNQLYGLFPVRSRDGAISNNEAQNTSLDAAIYVGQSDHVTLTGNTAHDNLLGLEVENSSDVSVTGSQLFNNTLGMVADINAGLQKKDQTNVVISDNDVHDNNRPNSGSASDTEQTPPGTGVVVLGGSLVTVEKNRISNNGFVGIIVANFCVSPSSCGTLDINPDPEHVRILDNELTNNGSMPPANPIEGALAADLIWDNTGTDNCWSGNTSTATAKVLGGGSTLPACQ
jgi:parallel beta-helix repeat protein